MMRDRNTLSRIVLPVLTVMVCLIALAPGLVRAEAVQSVEALKVTGQAEIILPDDTRKPLEQGDVILAGQSLETMPGASVVLKLPDDSTIEVFESSRVEINSILPKEKSKFSLSLFFGRITTAIKKLRGDDIVVTPTMVAGVRGTDFQVSVAEDGATVLNVEDGQVDVFTDKEGVKTSQVKVQPGQEVEAAQPGQILAARPATLDKIPAYQAFLKLRFDKMKEDLPGTVERIEQGIDRNLAAIDGLAAVPRDRAEVLKRLNEKLDEIPPENKAERARLTIQAYMETSKIYGAVQQFRIQRMRVETALIQSERLKDVLPTVAKPTSPEFIMSDKGLSRILGRKKEIRAQITLAAKQIDESLAPLRPFLDKFKKPGE